MWFQGGLGFKGFLLTVTCCRHSVCMQLVTFACSNCNGLIGVELQAEAMPIHVARPFGLHQDHFLPQGTVRIVCWGKCLTHCVFRNIPGSSAHLTTRPSAFGTGSHEHAFGKGHRALGCALNRTIFPCTLTIQLN